jgi:hypothetical protein
MQKLIDYAQKRSHPQTFPLRHRSHRRVPRKVFTFISIGNDLHHMLTQAGAYVNDMEGIAKEKARAGSEDRRRCSRWILFGY